MKKTEELRPSKDEFISSGLSSIDYSNWSFDVINENFISYDGSIYQMVYCLDTIKFLPDFEQLDQIDEEAPEDYKIFGTHENWGFYYAYNFMTDEIVLFDENKSRPVLSVALNEDTMLDALCIFAEFISVCIKKGSRYEYEEELRLEYVRKATNAAGGEKYLEFYEKFIC